MYGIRGFFTIARFWVDSFRTVIGQVFDIEAWKAKKDRDFYVALIPVAITAIGLVAVLLRSLFWIASIAIVISAIYGMTILIKSLSQNSGRPDLEEWSEQVKGQGDKTCGDYGGVTQKGEPCQIKAGGGTESSTGRCKHHRDQ